MGDIKTVDYDKRHNGWLTFFEHWGRGLAVIVIALAISQMPIPSERTFWISIFVASFTLMLLGGTLIGYAKFPVYRSGRFLTFGLKSVPQHLSRYYRWGWWLFLFGVVLALGLLFSNP